MPGPIFQQAAKAQRAQAVERFAVALRQRIGRERVAIARENDATEFKAVNGFGTIQARISQLEYFLAKIEYGWDCWNDPDFIAAYIRDNPEVRVKTTRGTRGQEYHDRRALPAGTIFVPKTYANG